MVESSLSDSWTRDNRSPIAEAVELRSHCVRALKKLLHDPSVGDQALSTLSFLICRNTNGNNVFSVVL